MAQQGSLPAGENCSQPFSPRFDPPRVECVDAAVENVETPRLNSSIDGPQAQSTSDQLATRQDAVLATRQSPKLSFALRERLTLPLFSTCR
jgi:hypothetical protein